MRTAIFVYERTTVAIRASESFELVEMNGNGGIRSLVEASEVVLDPGVYKIVSSQMVTVDGDTSFIYVDSTDDPKKPWPDPPPKAIAGLQASMLRAFFVIPGAKGSLDTV